MTAEHGKTSSKMASFVWDDPFLLEDQLSEDERMVRDAAAAFAADKLAPRIEDAYMEGHRRRHLLAGRRGDDRELRPLGRCRTARGVPDSADGLPGLTRSAAA